MMLRHVHILLERQVVEDGYEFFAKRQLVTLFSAPNYCGEFDNAGAMMSVDETLMCSFQVSELSCCVLLSCLPPADVTFLRLITGDSFLRVRSARRRQQFHHSRRFREAISNCFIQAKVLGFQVLPLK